MVSCWYYCLVAFFCMSLVPGCFSTYDQATAEEAKVKPPPSPTESKVPVQTEEVLEVANPPIPTAIKVPAAAEPPAPVIPAAPVPVAPAEDPAAPVVAADPAAPVAAADPAAPVAAADPAAPVAAANPAAPVQEDPIQKTNVVQVLQKTPVGNPARTKIATEAKQVFTQNATEVKNAAPDNKDIPDTQTIVVSESEKDTEVASEKQTIPPEMGSDADEMDDPVINEETSQNLNEPEDVSAEQGDNKSTQIENVAKDPKPISHETTAVMDEPEDTHFILYFITFSALTVVGYLVYQRRNRIIALVIEGRNTRGRGRGGSRRPSRSRSGSYAKLVNNLEEVITSSQSVKNSSVIY